MLEGDAENWRDPGEAIRANPLWPLASLLPQCWAVNEPKLKPTAPPAPGTSPTG